MALLFDTSALIPVRDNDPKVRDKLSSATGGLAMSAISLVELEGGVVKDPSQADRRRDLLELMLEGFDVLPFTEVEAGTYGIIVEQLGYSRRKLIDRMIAATALTYGLPLVTCNPRDFTGIPSLEIIDWELTDD